MREQKLPQQYPTFGLDVCLAQVRNIRSNVEAHHSKDDQRLGLAEQSIEAALHWLNQSPLAHTPKEPTSKKEAMK